MGKDPGPVSKGTQGAVKTEQRKTRKHAIGLGT